MRKSMTMLLLLVKAHELKIFFKFLSSDDGRFLPDRRGGGVLYFIS
jgi:hypothetical protein